MPATYEATLVAVTPASATAPTYSEVCGIPWTALTLVEEAGGEGLATISAPVDKIDADGKARLRDLTATPCELWVRRTDGTTSPIVHAGPITGVALNDRVITLTAPGLLAYLRYWIRDTDYNASLVDQATIVKALVDTWQALPFGNDGIITAGLTATGVVRDLNLVGIEGKNIAAVVGEMGQRSNGFDLTVNPTTRALTMWSPRKGDDRSASVILDQRSIGSPNLSWSVAPGVVGSEALALSSSALGGVLSSTQSNTTLRSTFGRSYVTDSFQDVSNQTTLDDHARRMLITAGSQSLTAAPTLLPVSGFAYGDFATGDLIAYDYDAGLGRQTATLRIATIETVVTSGAEQMRLGFL